MSALGVINGPDGPKVQLPLYSRKQTQLGHRAMFVSCQEQNTRPVP